MNALVNSKDSELEVLASDPGRACRSPDFIGVQEVAQNMVEELGRQIFEWKSGSHDIANRQSGTMVERAAGGALLSDSKLVRG
jgi:hypothetical protein